MKELSCCSALFNQRCILLGGLIELADGLADLRHPSALRHARRADFSNHIADLSDRGHHLLHGLPSQVDEGRTMLDSLYAFTDQ